MRPHFLVHAPGDQVGVAVMEIDQGTLVKGEYLEDEGSLEFETVDDIPLGHKIALTDLPEGTEVVEYGEVIGKTTQDVKRGQHVHVHNIRSVRWDYA